MKLCKQSNTVHIVHNYVWRYDLSRENSVLFHKFIEWLNLLIRISKFFEVHPKGVANHQTTHTLLSVHGIGRGGGGGGLCNLQ